MADKFNMSDVMISYSRRNKPFVQKLDQAFKAQGLEVWVDWEDIPPTANWWSEIEAGIEAAHSFVVIITPASAQSEICRREIDYALKYNKRLVPVLHEALTAELQAGLHPALAAHNWLYFRESDPFPQAFALLMTALQTDLDYNKMHTRLLVRGREWNQQGRSASRLLRGEDLRSAERWMLQSPNKTPQPLPEQVEYIQASRHRAGRFTQTVFGVTLAVLVTLSILLLIAFGQSKQATTQAQTALYEVNLRATQEQVAQSNLAAASTSQQIENDSVAAALTAQAGVYAAQTQAAQALLDSQNSETRAYVAQQNALTATVLQGQSAALAAQAQVQQTLSGNAAAQAQAQATEAQQQAEQANTQAAEYSIQGAGTAEAALKVAAANQAEAAEIMLVAAVTQTQGANIVIEAQVTIAAAAAMPAVLQETVDAAQIAAVTAKADYEKYIADTHDLREFIIYVWGESNRDYIAAMDGRDETAIAYYRLLRDFGLDGALANLTADLQKKLNDAIATCRGYQESGELANLSDNIIALCRELEVSVTELTPTDTPLTDVTDIPTESVETDTVPTATPEPTEVIPTDIPTDMPEPTEAIPPILQDANNPPNSP